MNIFGLGLILLLAGCNAYRSTPKSELLYTQRDITRNGFILGPVAVMDEKLNPGPAELVSYDIILENTLQQSWSSASLLSTQDIAKISSTEALEVWRGQLAKEMPSQMSESSLAFHAALKLPPKDVKKRFLLPSLLENKVTCSQRDSLSTGADQKSLGLKVYCQRLIKMRFRILSLDQKEWIWNGLIYATKENSAEIPLDLKQGQDSQDIDVEAPSTQTLIRDCFRNFAKQFEE